MNDWVYGCIRRIVRFFWQRPEIIGIDHIDRDRPAIFVSNHLGSFGPVLLTAHFPLGFTPWVTHEVTDRRLCPQHLEKEFVEREMHLRRPLSRLVAVVIGRVCVSVMEYIHAIPVHKKSRKLFIAVERSVAELGGGRHVLVFPELAEIDTREGIDQFHAGFVNVARNLYRRQNLIAVFYPVSVNKDENAIRIGEGIAYDPAHPFGYEKRRIVNYLRESIVAMYYRHEMPAGGTIKAKSTAGKAGLSGDWKG